MNEINICAGALEHRRFLKATEPDRTDREEIVPANSYDQNLKVFPVFIVVGRDFAMPLTALSPYCNYQVKKLKIDYRKLLFLIRFEPIITLNHEYQKSKS